MGRRLMKASGVDDLRKLESRMPFGRVCQPEDIANLVRHIVSDAGAYVTGEKFNMHGGGN
jgi:NAD(P)-dependent dehydrogenase (short-subunit alcohol dehydrogenase family)